MKHILCLFILCVSTQSVLAETSCYVPDGPIRAQAELRGENVILQDGRVKIGSQSFTVCNGLPGPYPTGAAIVKKQLYVGFRAAGIARFNGRTFERIAPLDPGVAVRTLSSWRNQLVVGTSRGLMFLHGGRLRKSSHRILGQRATTALAVDGRGDYTSPRVHMGGGLSESVVLPGATRNGSLVASNVWDKT